MHWGSFILGMACAAIVLIIVRVIEELFGPGDV